MFVIHTIGHETMLCAVYFAMSYFTAMIPVIKLFFQNLFETISINKHQLN